MGKSFFLRGSEKSNEFSSIACIVYNYCIHSDYSDFYSITVHFNIYTRVHHFHEVFFFSHRGHPFDVHMYVSV